ncbi:hypothetical protein CC80DRAFT_550261 [Byssothecium circinans]|uniref:Uncharacterized protein n=1 Tax=Byssothecium circinans TaxID=147558 RepID=A0A6A5TPT0_9PLEO|nr:hypothetical protein CC80DRAFT_550261 [Byssothecium circinans]
MNAPATRISFRDTLKLIKRDIKKFFKTGRKAKADSIQQSPLEVFQHYPDIHVPAIGDRTTAPTSNSYATSAVDPPHSTIDSSSAHISNENDILSIAASVECNGMCVTEAKYLPQSRIASAASTSDAVYTQNASQDAISSEGVLVTKHSVSLKERVRHGCRHVRVPSASSLASYQSRPSTDTSKRSRSTSPTIHESYADSELQATVPGQPSAVQNPCFPYIEAENLLKAWYKAPPGDAEDRWIQRGVVIVLSAAFEYTPHNPLYAEIFGDGYLAMSGPEYECGNRRLMSLLWTLKGERLGAVHTAEGLLSDVYPGAYAHELLHRFGNPFAEKDVDDLRAKLSAHLLPELSCCYKS